jgi:CheY-like chemotaxis protein
MLEKQEESETYGEENHLSSIAEECSDILVVAQKENICFQWLSIFSNMGVKNIQTRGYDEAVKLLDDAQVAAQNNPAEEKYPFSLIIVDVDFETIESFNMEENSTTSSESVLTHLQTEYTRLKTIPSICIADSRSRRSKQHPRTDVNKDMSNCAIQHPQGSREPMETPFDEAPDPLDCDNPISLHSLEKALNRVNHAKLTKPFKNSKLIATLHILITKNGAASATAIRRRYPSNEATANSSQHMSQQRVLTKKTKSSCSSGSRNMSASENPSTENLATVKTLIVDDNPVNQKVLSRMLSQIGLASTVAHNGKEAYNMYMESVETETPYELIFMDIWMPEMNGLEASEKIRSEQASTSTEPYIIALTACVMPGDKEKCTEAGMNGYVSKPIRKEELEASIHTFTQLRSK